jgi:hypothetical protein
MRSFRLPILAMSSCLKQQLFKICKLPEMACLAGFQGISDKRGLNHESHEVQRVLRLYKKATQSNFSPPHQREMRLILRIGTLSGNLKRLLSGENILNCPKAQLRYFEV